jgi:curved DNA-binding protein CbpA
MKTLYDLLGIDPKATQAQIEQGYKRRLDHYLERQGVGKPDEETRRMQMIREAYLLLCSPQRRQAYDQQLRLYQKARAQMSNRSNRKYVALLMVVLLLVIAGVSMRRTLHLGADPRAQEMREQSMAIGTAAPASAPTSFSEPAATSQQVAQSN